MLNFLTNEILDLFCSYEDRRIWDTLRDMLFRHGSQSEELIYSDLWRTGNRRDGRDKDKKRQPMGYNDLNYSRRALCKSSRIIICFVLTIMSHFKEEARKDMIEN